MSAFKKKLFVAPHVYQVLANFYQVLGAGNQKQSFQKLIGAILAHLGTSWRHLGPSWRHLGPSCFCTPFYQELNADKKSQLHYRADLETVYRYLLANDGAPEDPLN